MGFQHGVVSELISPQVSSVHDGHDQTQLCFGLKGVGQRHNKPAVNPSQDPLLHYRPLQERIGTALNQNIGI